MPLSTALTNNTRGNSLADKITTTWSSCNSSTDLPKSQFRLAELEESFVLQQLLALKTNKAIGLDKIRARLLKNSAHTIALFVTKLLNLSIKTGEFPKLWQCSTIIALFESADRTNASNYRPISILPTLSKISRESCKYTVIQSSSWLPISSSQEHSLDSGRDHCVAEWSARRTRNPRSRVRVPLWPLAGFVLGRPKFKFSATLVNSQLVAFCQLGFLILLCCI